jgi:hypothetical protein
MPKLAKETEGRESSNSSSSGSGKAGKGRRNGFFDEGSLWLGEMIGEQMQREEEEQQQGNSPAPNGGFREPEGPYKTAAAVLNAVRARYSNLASTVKQANSKMKLSASRSWVRSRSGKDSSSSSSRGGDKDEGGESSSSREGSGSDGEGRRGDGEAAGAEAGGALSDAEKEEWKKEVEAAVWHTADEAAWTAALKVLDGDKAGTYKVVEFAVPRYLDMLKEREEELKEAGLWPGKGRKRGHVGHEEEEGGGEEKEGKDGEQQQQQQEQEQQGKVKDGVQEDDNVIATRSGVSREGGNEDGLERVAVGTAAAGEAADPLAVVGSGSSSSSWQDLKERTAETAVADAPGEQSSCSSSSSGDEDETTEEEMKELVGVIATMQLRSMAEVGALNVATTADRFVARFMLVFGLMQEWGPFFTFAATNGNLLASFATSVVFLAGDMVLATVASQRWVSAQKRWAAEELGL